MGGQDLERHWFAGRVGVLRSGLNWNFDYGPEFDYHEDVSIATAADANDAASSAANAAGTAAYEAAVDVWRIGWADWYRDKWKPWLDRIISGYVTTPSTKPLVNLRRAGRHFQLSALREHLDAGVSQPHLAARYLSTSPASRMANSRPLQTTRLQRLSLAPQEVRIATSPTP